MPHIEFKVRAWDPPDDQKVGGVVVSVSSSGGSSISLTISPTTTATAATWRTTTWEATIASPLATTTLGVGQDTGAVGQFIDVLDA